MAFALRPNADNLCRANIRTHTHTHTTTMARTALVEPEVNKITRRARVTDAMAKVEAAGKVADNTNLNSLKPGEKNKKGDTLGGVI